MLLQTLVTLAILAVWAALPASANPNRDKWGKILDRPKAKTPWGLLPKGLTVPQIQNWIADKENLPVYRTRQEIEHAPELLLIAGAGVGVNNSPENGMPAWRSRCRAECITLLRDFDSAYHQASLGGEVIVNSAVRDIPTQVSIKHGGNSNAGKAYGTTASAHLRGPTFDLAKNPMSDVGVRWSQHTLNLLEKHGMVVHRNERRRQKVFHVFVTQKYTSGTLQRLLASEQIRKKKAHPKPRRHPRKARSR